MRGLVSAVVVFGVLFLEASDAHACSVVRVSPLDPATEVVQGSAVIVRATVIGDRTTELGKGKIRFSVAEVIRGEPISEVTLYGELVDHDDFNDRRVPYDSVRPQGRWGTCFAWQYKPGAEYLLMLSYSDSHQLILSPFPLEPVNEQLHSPNDPWLLWVRKQAKRQRSKR